MAVAALVALGVFLVGALAAYPQASGPCVLGPGYDELRAQLGAEIVGDCVQQPVSLPSGDTQQRTTAGLLFWRKVDNVPGFTDGATTWLLGPNGLEERANTEILPWEPTPTPTPRPTATLAVPDVTVVAQGFGVKSGNGLAVTYAAVLRNQRADRVATNVSYLVTGYDGAGAVLLSDAGTVGRIPPAGQASIANTLALDAFVAPGQTLTRLEVRLTSASFPAADPGAALVVTDAAYGSTGSVVGNAHNTSTRDIGYARLVAVVYGVDGSIAGGGSSYSSVLPAGATLPVSVPVDVWASPSRAELTAEPLPPV